MFLRPLLFLSIFAALAAQEQGVKICLLLVAKDRDTAIEACLKSAEKIIDAVFLIDQGKTHLSSFFAEQWFEDSKIPGMAVFYDKADFQEFSMRTAKNLLEELHFIPENSYFLLLDPDMTVKVAPEFQKETLDKDSYLILQKSSALGLSSYDLFLLRASLPWVCTDPILGRWSSKEAGAPAKLEQISIDGGSSNLDQMIKKLTLSLAEDSQNNRYLLYLAQAFKGKREYEKAIRQYQKRIEGGGDQEEIWFSTFMIGSCYEELGDWAKALRWYLDAFQMRPDRPDSLQKIATYYRRTVQHDLAYLFAKQGSLITCTLDQNLFGYPPLADYQFQEEISIAAYYTRFKEEGFLAASDLALKKNTPLAVKDQNGRNIFCYTPLLKDAKFQQIPLSLPPIERGAEKRYLPKAASILKTEGGYKLICEAVNYTQTGGKIFQTADSRGLFRTKNFLIALSPDFQVLKQREIVENLPRERFPACFVEGLESPRLFKFNGSDWFACTTTDTNPLGASQVSLCKLSDGKVEKMIPLLGPDPARSEKNWLPFVHDGQLQLIHSYDPLTLLIPRLETGECEASIPHKSPLDLSRFRGSAAPIPFDGGTLALIHEAVHYPDYTRCYLHRFLFLGPQLQIEKISPPFVFLHQGIERCSGMTIDQSGAQLILSVGIEDKELHLCTLPIESVRSLLR